MTSLKLNCASVPSFEEVDQTLSNLLFWEPNICLVNSVYEMIRLQPHENWGNSEIIQAYLKLQEYFNNIAGISEDI
ncbi:hypothetical protein WH8501_05615 [Crocosphaera watsonii WH 8501]|uniref:Uncharacterized protein n=3 Tax=Crocosphaera watsonii TaxID=263511 RepID=T2JW75_CROWT|nr:MULTISPECIES: hypothetical protein [Crocosphaera]MCH2243033.1 hypothetical protein [Crocosphaera sp.]CCQ52236.1 hypothetical protein CWATWH8502_1604 [Crocosphaera watsonii WH 8502]CCQ57535.1 hypothetical protein CWATWH0005_3065 [Crocosphaera watsonii WH 0005]CCQ69276.1 hypothetical protein CWATWH0402_2023 [Crocosphaera watsonii WH 0402]